MQDIGDFVRIKKIQPIKNPFNNILSLFMYLNDILVSMLFLYRTIPPPRG